jgi:MOSC domain-containing protein
VGVLAIWRYTDERIANKRGPTDPALRACRAQLLDDAGLAPPLKVTLPDGTVVVGAEIVAALSDWDARRFRPNLVLDDGAEPGAFSEDALLGRSLRAPSGCALRVGLPTPRCVVTTRAQDDMPRDPAILRTIARHHLIDVGAHGRYACAGAYAEVLEAGRVGVGDWLALSAEAA